MTKGFSPTQQRIVDEFKGHDMTVESVAKALRMKVSNLRVQLSRIRIKDEEARSYHAKVNSLMAHYPSFRLAMKGSKSPNKQNPVPTPGNRELSTKMAVNRQEKHQGPAPHKPLSRHGQRGRTQAHPNKRLEELRPLA